MVINWLGFGPSIRELASPVGARGRGALLVEDGDEVLVTLLGVFLRWK
jgi:hypothetical protein